jgi:regulator of extracellular matrix RemA (YlzA/DUF370 family)
MFISIGYGNFVDVNKVNAILKPGSAPMRKLKELKREENKLVDATFGKPTRAFVLLENGTLIMSAISTQTLIERFDNKTYEE